MQPVHYSLLLLISLFMVLAGCDLNAPGDGESDGNGSGDDIPAYRDASSSQLPVNRLSGNNTQARSLDLQQDGDTDLVVAAAFAPNILLLNDGSGDFTDGSPSRLVTRDFDTRDIALADLNGNNLPDLFFASAENRTNELFLNSGGVFNELSGRIPVTGISHAALATDLNEDGSPDLLIGNRGQNFALINNGNGFFATDLQRLPSRQDFTNNLAIGDLDGDGDPDLIISNDDENRLLINTGSGVFQDQTETRMPLLNIEEETQEAALDDIDGDGDPDIFLANASIRLQGSVQDRLLLNDGSGVFRDETSSRLPEIDHSTASADFVDIDSDGDQDIITGIFEGGLQVLINDGTGTFTDETGNWIPSEATPRVRDIEFADLTGNGLPEIYIAAFGEEDRLLVRR